MDAKGLQRGNWIAYNSSGNIKYMQVLEIHEEKLICRKGEQQLLLYYDSSSLEPIPLTPEILEKAGFERWDQSNIFEYKINDQSIQIFNKEVALCGADCVTSGQSFNLPVEINHVHELQNLYYALYSEELQIEL